MYRRVRVGIEPPCFLYYPRQGDNRAAQGGSPKKRCTAFLRIYE